MGESHTSFETDLNYWSSKPTLTALMSMGGTLDSQPLIIIKLALIKTVLRTLVRIVPSAIW